MDVLGQALGGDALRQIGGGLGLDARATEGAVGMALPMLITALARNASTESGLSSLDAAVARDHDGSILDDLGGFLGGGQAASGGAAILKHVFGGRQEAMVNGLSRSSGLDVASAGKLLAMLAPIVLAALGRGRQASRPGGGLGDLLGGARASVQQQAPQGADFISQILDANQDGSVVDDVARLGMNVLGGLFGGRR
jgi:hypothetical protein